MIRLSILMFPLILCAQLLNLPESIVFDADRDRYIVSNWGDGRIIELDTLGNQQIFSDRYERIAGLYRDGDDLYVACNLAPDVGVARFDLATDSLVDFFPIPEAELPNDICVDTSGHLFVTDYWGSAIYRINLAAGTASLFWDTGFNMPNGILFDPRENRIIMTSNNESPSYPLRQIHLADSTMSILVRTYLSGLDGLAFDSEYRLYASTWSRNAIERYPADMSGGFTPFSTGHNSPADIYFDAVNSLLCVPNFGDSTLSFVPVFTENIAERPPKPAALATSLNPNPFNSTLSITAPTNARITIHDTQGRQIADLGTGRIWNPGDDVPSGIYLVRVQSGGEVGGMKAVLVR